MPRTDTLNQIHTMPSPQSHTSVSKKSWRAPLIILLDLVAGFGFALAHHLLGKHLNGKPIDDILVPQAWISRISTALAFVVKVALAISVGTAYVQHQWLRFHKQSFKTNDVDALTSVLGSALSFIGSAIWLRHPLLTLMALVSWSIPLATITAPGSLTVLPMSFNTTMLDLKVPQLQFDNETNYGNSIVGQKIVAVRPLMNKLAFHTAIAAQTIPIASSYPNESYHLDFYGPAIKCSVLANISMVRDISIWLSRESIGGIGKNFVSWVGGGDAYPREEVSDATLDILSENGSRIIVVSDEGDSTTSWNFKDGRTNYTAMERNVVECILHNASYSVRTVFRYPQQSDEVSITRWLNTVQPRSQSLINENVSLDAVVSYLSVMSAFGKLLVGTGYWDYTTGSGSYESYLSSWSILDIDWSNRELVPRQLERLFQNITLSLRSNSGLIKNSSVAEPVNVTVENWKVTYVYTESGLLIVYGISLMCTIICAMVGFYAFFVNDASYQNVFSTFLRATNDLEIRSTISSGDTGSDPLPEDLAETAVTLSSRDATYNISACLTEGKGKSDDLELQPLRQDGIETPWDRGSSVGREPSDVAAELRDPVLLVRATGDS